MEWARLFPSTSRLTAKTSVFIVMDFLEHDLKTLQEDMQEPFLPSETKTLLLQLTSAVQYLHDNWILHRDLKTSNLLMNNRGQLKIADFGMARYFSDPPPPKLTQLVVTLWYRSPELLLGAEKYGREVDMWSVGCIFGEFLTKEPLLQGKNEVDQLSKVHRSLQSPSPNPLTLPLTHRNRYFPSSASPPPQPGPLSPASPTPARSAFPPTPTPPPAAQSCAPNFLSLPPKAPPCSPPS